jgi:hypothetical protein
MANAIAEATEVKRLNVNLPAAAFEELQRMASNSGRSMTEVVRLALGLAKIAIEEEKKDHKLVVAQADGQILKEIVLPK